MKTVKWTLLNGETSVTRVKHHVSYLDVCAMATAVKDKMFEKGYHPYRRELDYVWQVLANYTDLQFDDVNEMMEEYEYGALQKAVMSQIDSKQLAKLNTMIDDMVYHEKRKTGMDRIGELLMGLIANGVLNDVLPHTETTTSNE